MFSGFILPKDSAQPTEIRLISALTHPKGGETKGCVRGCGSEEVAFPKLLLRVGL